MSCAVRYASNFLESTARRSLQARRKGGKGGREVFEAGKFEISKDKARGYRFRLGRRSLVE